MQVFGRPFSHPALTAWSVHQNGPGRFSFSAPPEFEADFSEAYPSSASMQGAQAVLTFGSLARFGINFDTQEIVVLDQADGSTPNDLSHFLFDHVAPRILARQGHLVLHGAALGRDGVLIGLLGETGAGKSTLAASLAQRGYTLIGDDSVLISESSGRYFGTSIYPSLRLFPESISAVYAAAPPSSAMANYSDKRRLDLATMSQPPARPMPLAALFYLSDEFDDDGPAATALSPAQFCMKCTEQSFAMMPTDPSETRARFAQIARLTSAVPGFALDYERNFANLPIVHELIDDVLNCAQPLAPVPAQS